MLATNKTVCTVSVIHSQIEDPEAVIRALSSTLELEESEVRKKVEKVSSMERIKTNVEKETGDKIREMNLAGSKWMKTLNGIIHMKNWRARCLDLPEETTRESSGWK